MAGRPTKCWPPLSRLFGWWYRPGLKKKPMSNSFHMFGGRVRWIQTKCHDLNFSNQEERKTFSGFTPRERKKRKREKKQKRAVDIPLMAAQSRELLTWTKVETPWTISADDEAIRDINTITNAVEAASEFFPRGKEEEEGNERDGDGWMIGGISWEKTAARRTNELKSHREKNKRRRGKM